MIDDDMWVTNQIFNNLIPNSAGPQALRIFFADFPKVSRRSAMIPEPGASAA